MRGCLGVTGVCKFMALSNLSRQFPAAWDVFCDKQTYKLAVGNESTDANPGLVSKQLWAGVLIYQGCCSKNNLDQVTFELYKVDGHSSGSWEIQDQGTSRFSDW